MGALKITLVVAGIIDSTDKSRTEDIVALEIWLCLILRMKFRCCNYVFTRNVVGRRSSFFIR